MSDNYSKSYKFQISNGLVTGIQEFENGRWRSKRFESDESWSYDGTQVIKTEFEDGRVQTTAFTDTDNNGIFNKSTQSFLNGDPAIQGSVATNNGYKFDVSGDTVTAAYELKRGVWVTDRIESDETYTVSNSSVIKTETEHGFIETTVFDDTDGDGIYQKVSKSYAVADGTTIVQLEGDHHGGDVDDAWNGTDADDYYYASSGNDSLSGGIGNDSLYGGIGNDSLYGGSGDDYLYAASGNDLVDGGLGNDMIVGGDGAGDDVYKGGGGIDTVKYTSATAGIKVDLSRSMGIAGSLTTSKVDSSGIGNDKLYDIENIIAGNYDDLIKGSASANTISGELGNDTISGGNGDDMLYGGDGKDKLNGDNNNDFLFGESGDDVLSGDNGADTIDGGQGADRILGGSGNDVLTGGDGNDSIDGGADADIVYGSLGGGGDDVLNGGAGIDTLDYSLLSDGIKIDVAKGLAGLINGDTSAIGTDRISNFEKIITGGGDDVLLGNSSADSFFAGSGNDLIYGAGGKDALYGGEGDDIFIYKSVSESGLGIKASDVIYDFSATDKIDLSGIDAKLGATANDAFVFIESKANLTKANANGALWFENGSIYGSNDYDVAAEFSITIVGYTTFDLNNFIL